MKNILTTISIIILLSGCSVGMAMSGKATPDMGVVKQDTTRGEVELQLGSPVSVATLDNGHVLNIYEYEVGNDPSAGRAIGHGVMDVLTLGLWEVVGTPIEGFQGDKRQVQVEYDANDKVVSVKGAPQSKQL
jgi:uncharacterized protein YceK